MTAGTLTALKDNALGTGNISLTGGTVVLLLQGGATNNYIGDAASISIATGALANLNFTGSDSVGGIVLNGVAQTTPGTYGSTSSGATFQSAFFSGTGTLTLGAAVPEPATWMLMGFGLLVGAQRFRRKS